MSSEIHVGDIGTYLVVKVCDDGQVVDISSAIELILYIRKPNGVKMEKTALLYIDGTDGQMYYVAIDGDFDSPGNYKLQGKVTLPTGVYYTSTASFKVHCNL